MPSTASPRFTTTYANQSASKPFGTPSCKCSGTAAALLAAGLLGSTAVAQTQTSVTLYGMASTAVHYTSNIDGHHNNKAQMVSSGIGGSRWGLRGSEDLGGGNKAVFTLEHGIALDTGNSHYSAYWGRQAFVGLQGDWGSLTLGRQYNALNNIGWAFNPLDQSWGNFWSDPIYTGGDVFYQGYRIDNSVVYQHTMGPVSVQLDYGFGEEAGSSKRGTTLGGGVMYQQGPLAIGVAYDQQRSRTGNSTQRSYSLGASYALGQATAYIGHMGHRESDTRARQHISFVGLGYQLTPSVHVSGAYYRYQQNGQVQTQFQATPVQLGKGHADAIAAVVDYALSKRTNLYLSLDVTRARNGAVGRETEYWGGTPRTDIDSTTRTSVMAGIRHAF